ncbi:MAG TPA: DmsC/YnfH family molybdoenzyme membrane anchor subunit [Stellaceae bacterium]|jgi:DMSO reductase anchor subunit|nr:DmsC/YnfH family molybdoenzyme membrane anchor subunit [Stellaceae bacterium]
MHPALSIIIFTVSSGAGYGLMALTGVLAAAGLLPEGSLLGLAALSLSLAAIGLGLGSSTAHLGRPERAWRALSQWRSSWLSREGVAAFLSLIPAGLLWLALLLGGRAGAVAPLGVAAAALAVATVWCTAMIYRSLAPIRQWHNPLVLPNYLALALMTGALWLSALAALLGEDMRLPRWIALAATAGAAVLKIAYWSAIDRAAPALTAADATGLRGGAVRLFEAPHTEENYLLKEMGYRIARKHAQRLRRIALAASFALPFLLSAAALLIGVIVIPATLLAALLGTAGVLVERWLFFAEAKHTVTLYYGAGAV